MSPGCEPIWMSLLSSVILGSCSVNSDTTNLCEAALWTVTSIWFAFINCQSSCCKLVHVVNRYMFKCFIGPSMYHRQTAHVYMKTKISFQYSSLLYYSLLLFLKILYREGSDIIHVICLKHIFETFYFFTQLSYTLYCSDHKNMGTSPYTFGGNQIYFHCIISS